MLVWMGATRALNPLQEAQRLCSWMVQRRLMTSSPGHGANTWWSISKGFTVTLKEKFKKQSYRMKFTKTQNNLKLQKNHLLLIAHHENLNVLFQENWIKAVAKIVSPFLHANVIKYMYARRAERSALCVM